MSGTRPLPDAAARGRAATDLEANLVVLAGAGTGKTSLLVERMLNAVGSGVAPLDRLAAITFTEKAAGEMRERLALGLEKLGSLAEGEARETDGDEADRAFAHLTETLHVDREAIAARALAAIDALDRATVVTIHGFCSELLRRFPADAGVDPDFVVDSGEQEESLRRAEWQAYLARELGPRAPRAAEWRRLFDALAPPEVEAVARWLSGFSIPETLLRPPFEQSPVEPLLIGEARRLCERMTEGLRRQQGMNPNARGLMESMTELLGVMVGEGHEAFCAAVARNPVVQKKVESAKAGLPTPGKRLRGLSAHDCTAMMRAFVDLARALGRVNETLPPLLLELLAPFALEFRQTFLRQGYISFDGLLALTRDLLRDHPAVRERIKQRFRMLLVDEFQDTDPLQYEIVLFLAETPGDRAGEAYAARLEPGRLFIVGDAKQSIYRFRGADFTAYRRAVARILDCGGTALDLTGNFRSTPELLEPINALFESAVGCWQASAYQPEYVPIRAVRGDDGAPPVEVWTVEPKGRLADDRREAEGRVLAQTVEDWVEAGTYRYSEITMVFRAYTKISHYLRPLRERGIPFVVDGGREFLQRPETAQLLAALRTVAQPNDAAALLAFLRSPAGGVSDTALAEFAAAGGRWDWRVEADADRFPLVAARLRLLREIAEEAATLPVDAVVRRVARRTSLLPLSAAAFEGAQRVANLHKLVHSAGELARDGRLSLDEVIEALREGRMAGIDADSPLADEVTDAVRITSIHRIKGLENRVILFPDLAREKGSGFPEPETVQVARLPDGDQTLALKFGNACNLAQVWLAREDARHEEAEEFRVFYVALTRARERLVVVVGPALTGKTWVEALTPWGYARKSPPEDGARLADGRVVHRRLVAGPPRPKIVEPLSETTQDLARAYSAAVRRLHEGSPPPFHSPSDLPDERRTFPVASAGASRELARRLGTLAHRFLEHWDPKADARARIAALCEEMAEPGRIETEELERAAGGLLGGFLESDLAGRLQEVDVLGREVPLLLRAEDGGVYRGSIDLLYRDAGGNVVVADYKTDEDADEARLAQRYAGQLAVYARAVRESLGLLFDPLAELWLLRHGRRIAVDLDRARGK